MPNPDPFRCHLYVRLESESRYELGPDISSVVFYANLHWFKYLQ